LTLDGDNELLGHGSVRDVGKLLRAKQTALYFDVFSNRQAIDYIQERFRNPSAFLQLRFDGLLRVRDDRPMSEVVHEGDLARGEWHYVPIDPPVENVRIEVPKSVWVSKVLEPLGYGEHILIDLPVPMVPERDRYQKALSHLRTAQEHFLLGNDPGVFAACRAIFESLEGAPKQIFDQMQDEEKRKRVNDLLLQTMTYFHTGRHVSKSGPQQGEFPVDHRDAEFALGLAKLFLAYTAKLLIHQ